MIVLLGHKVIWPASDSFLSPHSTTLSPPPSISVNRSPLGDHAPVGPSGTDYLEKRGMVERGLRRRPVRGDELSAWHHFQQTYGCWPLCGTTNFKVNRQWFSMYSISPTLYISQKKIFNVAELYMKEKKKFLFKKVAFWTLKWQKKVKMQ